MRVLFLQKEIFAKPGIMLLSAILKQAGHDCDVLVEDLERDIVRKALDLKPEVIAFSVTSLEAAWMHRVGTDIRGKYRGAIICGGAHPTYLTRYAMDETYLDAICVGEGEDALVEYVSSLEKGIDVFGIANLIARKGGDWVRNDVRPLIEDLDSLPFPDRSVYDRYPLYRRSHGGILYHYTVMTGRGCPYECSYCFNRLFKNVYQGKGKVVRRRSVDNVIRELHELKSRKPGLILFEDDSFTLPPRDWLESFLQRYRDEIGIPFKMQTAASLLDDDLMVRLKEANCFSFKMGVESGNEPYRREILKKNVTDDEIILAARLAHKHGIRFQTFNMAGGPGETLRMARETFRLNRIIRPDFVWCSLLHPVPGTEIYDYSVSRGHIDESLYTLETVGQSVFLDVPIKMRDKTEILNLQKLMCAGILCRTPEKIFSLLIRLPLGSLYRLIFGITFFIGVYRTNRTGILDLTRLSLRHWGGHLVHRPGGSHPDK